MRQGGEDCSGKLGCSCKACASSQPVPPSPPSPVQRAVRAGVGSQAAPVQPPLPRAAPVPPRGRAAATWLPPWALPALPLWLRHRAVLRPHLRRAGLPRPSATSGARLCTSAATRCPCGPRTRRRQRQAACGTAAAAAGPGAGGGCRGAAPAGEPAAHAGRPPHSLPAVRGAGAGRLRGGALDGAPALQQRGALCLRAALRPPAGVRQPQLPAGMPRLSGAAVCAVQPAVPGGARHLPAPVPAALPPAQPALPAVRRAHHQALPLRQDDAG